MGPGGESPASANLCPSGNETTPCPESKFINLVPKNTLNCKIMQSPARWEAAMPVCAWSPLRMFERGPSDLHPTSARQDA